MAKVLYPIFLKKIDKEMMVGNIFEDSKSCLEVGKFLHKYPILKLLDTIQKYVGISNLAFF